MLLLSCKVSVFTTLQAVSLVSKPNSHSNTLQPFRPLSSSKLPPTRTETSRINQGAFPFDAAAAAAATAAKSMQSCSVRLNFCQFAAERTKAISVAKNVSKSSSEQQRWKWPGGPAAIKCTLAPKSDFRFYVFAIISFHYFALTYLCE